MKSCPTCNRTFEDTFTFCLVDGAILSAPFDPHATLIGPEPRQTAPPPTKVLRLQDEIRQEIPATIASPQPEQQPEESVATIVSHAPAVESTRIKDSPARSALKPGRSPLIMVGVGALLIIGLIIFIIANQAGSPTENSNRAKTAMTPTALPAAANSSNSNQTSITTATPTPKPSPTPVANLEGTVWQAFNGKTAFEFKQNGRIIDHANRMADGNWQYNVRGTWTRQGDKLLLDFPKSPYFEHYRYEATIQGDEMKFVTVLGEMDVRNFTAHRVK